MVSTTNNPFFIHPGHLEIFLVLKDFVKAIWWIIRTQIAAKKSMVKQS